MKQNQYRRQLVPIIKQDEMGWYFVDESGRRRHHQHWQTAVYRGAEMLKRQQKEDQRG